MIDRVDTNEQGRVIISGFREYRNRGRAQGVRFPPRCTKLGERNHIISTFVIPTSAPVIWKMTCYKVIPRAFCLSPSWNRHKTNNVIKSTRWTVDLDPLNTAADCQLKKWPVVTMKGRFKDLNMHVIFLTKCIFIIKTTVGKYKRNSGPKPSDYHSRLPAPTDGKLWRCMTRSILSFRFHRDNQIYNYHELPS